MPILPDPENPWAVFADGSGIVYIDIETHKFLRIKEIATVKPKAIFDARGLLAYEKHVRAYLTENALQNVIRIGELTELGDTAGFNVTAEGVAGTFYVNKLSSATVWFMLRALDLDDYYWNNCPMREGSGINGCPDLVATCLMRMSVAALYMALKPYAQNIRVIDSSIEYTVGTQIIRLTFYIHALVLRLSGRARDSTDDYAPEYALAPAYDYRISNTLSAAAGVHSALQHVLTASSERLAPLARAVAALGAPVEPELPRDMGF